VKRERIKRRTLIEAAAGAVAVSGVTTLAAPHRAQAQDGEHLSDYASHTSNGRSITVTSGTGQRLRLMAYGDQIIRVSAVRAAEDFFSDTRYEMVVPANHDAMVGTLGVEETDTDLTITTGASDGPLVRLLKSPLRLEFYARDTSALLAKEDSTHGITWGGANNSVITEAFVPTSSERFFKAGHGFFGRSPRLERTGDTVEHNYGTQPGYNEQAPAIVPFYLSSNGYGVFFNTTFDTTFRFGVDGVYEFSADEHNTSGPRPQLDYFLINGPRFPQLLDRYTQLTGRPRLPQLSIFGLQLSDKNFPNTSDQFWWQDKITEHRDAGFPFDHHVNDNRWREGSGAWSGSWFEFSDDRWPDPAGYQEWAADNGVTVTLDYNRNNSDEMAGWVGGPPPGYSFRSSDLSLVNENDAVPDWSNPDARAWVWDVFWTQALDPALGYPGDGLWIDESDDLGPIPYGARTADGRTWSETRNAYFFQLHKAVVEEGWDPDEGGHIGPAKRPWVFSRGASAGQQRYGHYWTGDIQSSYDEMRNQIRGMLVGGLGGFPFSNIDGGGFFGSVISDALYRNWPAAWSSFSPIWRLHSGASTSSSGQAASRWPLDQSGTVQETFRTYGVLRYTLMPYIYTLAHQAAASGMPMARAMVIDHQDRPNAYTHDLQYMWGPSFLVAPLTSDGGGNVNIWLPAGSTWYDFWSDTVHDGSDSGDLSYGTSTGRLPLFVKAGAILPKYPYAQSTAFFTKEQLEAEVYAGADGTFDLVEDDGVTESYRIDGAMSVTRLAYTDAATRVVVAHPEGTYEGAPAARRYLVRFHGLDAPLGMHVNDGPTLPALTGEAAAIANDGGTVWNETTQVLTVVTPTIPVEVDAGSAAVIEPSGDPFPTPGGGAVHSVEEARLEGTVISTHHPRYTGTGYADLAGASADGAAIEWTVPVSVAGTKRLVFRYASGSVTRPLEVSVNGTAVAALSFPPTAGWSTWATTSCATSLPAGNAVSIRVTSPGAHGPNIDNLTII
jgi:alpha-D-xyloside xylohydrolase